MNDLVMILIVLAGGFVLVGGVAYLFERRAKTKGSLFTAAASPLLRILALLLGLLFAGFSVLEVISMNRFHIILPVLAIALIAYSLGSGYLLKSLQHSAKTSSEKPPDEDQM